MMMRGKQTGRLGSVKQNDPTKSPVFVGLMAFLALSLVTACAPSVGGWRSPVKNEASTRADYAFCKNRAEQATLQLRQAKRPGFGNDQRPGQFNPRGDDTMAIADRSDTTSLYDALISNCMSSKGYRLPGDPRPRNE